MNPILSHFRAGSGAVLVETREESRFLRQLLDDIPRDTSVMTIAAPSGALKCARTGRVEKDSGGLVGAYQWAADGIGRMVVVFDYHMLINNPGHWRSLMESLPRLRCPKGARDTDPASLMVFLAPGWELSPQNPLRGSIPVIPFDLPDRESLRAAAAKLRPLPAGPDGELIVDALCGLSADSAEQSAAEVLARCNKWDTGALRNARKQQLREAGLELWTPVQELGGLAGYQSFFQEQVFPWIRDPQLSVKRILAAGVPGVGKSYGARWVANRLNCECARLSIPSLKAGIVGASEQNLRRALRTIDALSRHSPVVVVLDEIDTIAREGMDGGTSSGMFAELLTWLEESKKSSQAVVLATLNRLDKLDAALASRFQAQFFFDLPCIRERAAVAKLYYTEYQCADPVRASVWTADATDGFSSREIVQLTEEVARLSQRKPTEAIIQSAARGIKPTSQTMQEQLATMRRAAGNLRRANDVATEPEQPTGRRVQGRAADPGNN
jgi:hypothetical protein